MNQQKVEDIIVARGLVKTLDILVEAVVDRLKNPNKTLFGSKAPVSESDTTINQCKNAIKNDLKNALLYRKDVEFLAGREPPQYAELRSLLPPGIAKDTYNNPYANYLDGMQRFVLVLSQGGQVECRNYTRILNLFKQTTKEDKYNFEFEGIYAEIARAIRPFKAAKTKAEADEIAKIALTEQALEVNKFPSPPGAVSVQPPEPAPNVNESDISTELNSTSAAASSAPKLPLTSADRMKIAGMANQLANNPAVQKRRLTTDQIRQMAENIYRRKTGKGRRKTSGKKKASRKTRKVRRV